MPCGETATPSPSPPEHCVAFRLTPKDSSFYDMFTVSAENLVEATDVLSTFVHEHTRREELGRTLRDLEHKGDQATHAIFRQVNSSFVTPFDREDIYNLASDLDDVMDCIEAAADLVVLTKLGTLPAEMGQQVALLQRCAQVTAESMPRLRSMKDLSDYWIEVNRLENEADQLYRRTVATLYCEKSIPVAARTRSNSRSGIAGARVAGTSEVAARFHPNRAMRRSSSAMPLGERTRSAPPGPAALRGMLGNEAVSSWTIEIPCAATISCAPSVPSVPVPDNTTATARVPCNAASERNR